MWRGCDRLFCKREEIATCQAVQSANLSGTGSFQKNDSITKKFPQHKWEGKKNKKQHKKLERKFNQENIVV